MKPSDLSRAALLAGPLALPFPASAQTPAPAPADAAHPGAVAAKPGETGRREV